MIAYDGHWPMKTLLDRPYARFPRATDWLLSVLVWPGALLLRAYRRFGSARLPLTTRRFRDIGVFPVLHFYSDPLFNPYILTRSLDEDRHLPGIDLRPAAQLKLLSEFSHGDEIRTLRWDTNTPESSDYSIHNTYFAAGDADFLYQFLRTLKPRRVLEVGSGFSTKIAHRALLENARETGVTALHKCIEPYETDRLHGLGGIDLIATPLEDCTFDWDTELGAGDLLFIDSSHIIRPQGDVLKEYLEILPQLPSGVFIHVHDIFTPRDYPSRWLKEDVLFWNEQYLLEAMLSCSTRYEVVAALNFLKHHHFAELAAACPHLTEGTEPGSFYLRVR
jgi:hypothetical protein